MCSLWLKTIPAAPPLLPRGVPSTPPARRKNLVYTSCATALWFVYDLSCRMNWGLRASSGSATTNQTKGNDTMKNQMPLLAAATLALASASALAKTLVWNTSVTTSSSSPAMLSEAANWLENGEPASTGPEPGDRLEIAASSDVYFGAETFDIGSAGLTIYHTRKIYIKTVFTGPGVLTFDGSNVERVFNATTSSSHTGGTVIKSGWSKFNASGIPLGSGPVTIYQASADRPRLEARAYHRSLLNDFVLVGDSSISGWTVFNQEWRTTVKSLTSDHDFNIVQQNRGFIVNGDVSAPGKTVTFQVVNAGDSTHTEIKGAIDANVVVKAYGNDAAGASIVTFSGASTVVTNTLTITSGTNILAAAAAWAGTNITVGTTATLSLKGAGNLSPAAHLTVAEGGTIEVANNVTVQIAALTVGGTDLLPGIYTAATLPGTISGNGTLLVLGDSPFVWTGADEDNPTQWSVAANWKCNTVPGDGAVVYFPADAVVSNTASTVAVGASGLTFVLGGTVDLRDPLTGSGALTVTGTGRLNLDDAATHTGGTTISGSTVLAPYAKTSPLGTEGTITIDGSGGGNPLLMIPIYGTTIPNDVVINGVITNRAFSGGGKTGYGAIILYNAATFNGNITGYDDILLTTHYSYMTLNGSITVPEGKTIRLCNLNTENDARIVSASGTLTGNLSVEGRWPVRLAATATCSGNVSVAASATLQLKAAGNLAETAVVSVETGGQIDIASDVKVQVAELYVGGVQQPHGVYNATNLPAVITGSGTLQVGPTTATVISFR